MLETLYEIPNPAFGKENNKGIAKESTKDLIFLK